MHIPPEKIVDYAVSFFALYILVLFLLIYLTNREKILNYPRATEWKPTISVVVPAYNEERNLERCIDSLLNSNYPKDKLEIIVVDDGSTDNTYNIASDYKKFGVKVFRKKNEGTAAAAKNYGIQRAKGELIATLDADSYVSKEAINRILPLFSEKEIVAVTSAVKVAKTKTFLQKLQKIEYVLTIFSRRILSFIDAVFVTPGPFSVFRASVFKRIGLFDEKSILEDQEIALRIQKHNLRIASSLDAEVFTNVPGTFFSLIRQRIRWHRGGLINSLNYLSLMSPKYGDFGMIIMPISLLAVLAIFVVLINVSLTFILQLDPSGKFFMENLLLVFQPVHFIGIVILILTVAFSLHQLSFFKKEKINPLWAIIYIICYAYLITLYWIVAIGKQIFGEEVSW